MVEYIYDVIRIMAGQDAEITAIIKDEYGDYIIDNCFFILHDKDGSVITKVAGVNENNIFHFILPSEVTLGMKGKYWYSISDKDGNLCFLKPIYLM